MADVRPFPNDAQLQAALRQVGREIAYPPTPALAERVVARLEAGEGRRPLAFPARWLLAAAAVLLVLMGVFAASPAARTAVADRLGLRGVEIIHLPFVPTPTPTPTLTPAPINVPTPTPPPVGARLNLGEPVAFDAIGGRVAFTPARPTAPELGEPDEVYVGSTPRGGRVSLVYRSRPGLPPAGETGVALLLIQFRADFDAGFVGKGLGPGTRLEQVRVGGQPAFWIEGLPHFVLFRASDGSVQDDPVRLAGNVLLWEHGDLTLRIEGGLGKELALRMAESVR